MWVRHNENPDGRNVGDCTVRAISTALKQDWETTYVGLSLQGFLMGDMPSANHVDECPDCYTVADFAAEHPSGTYILSLSGHVVCVMDGDYYDTWDSGGEIPLYYWCKEE